MKGWETDKLWADKAFRYVRSICGRLFVADASIKEDQEENTDLRILTINPIRIACRIRRGSYFPRYAHQFTLRDYRPTGMKTELAKIVDGFGDYFFYGFAKDNGELLDWKIGDLEIFRFWYQGEIELASRIPGQKKTNGDGSSEFKVFEWTRLPEPFIVAAHSMPFIEWEGGKRLPK